MQKILFLFIAVFVVLNNPAQLPTPDEKIIAGLKKWNEENPQEKVFVQTDKDKYLTGEAIWIKLWCTIDAKPSFLSKIVYVVLNDDKGNVVEKKMYPLNELASANGVIDVDKNIKSGNYTFCAYTLWMLNYPQYVFKKTIYIYNTDYKSKTTNRPQPGFELTFFPEGGNLITGVQGRVAFKAINSSGFPAGVKGTVYSTNGTKVIDFASQHDGMGLFEFQPLENTSYIAKVVFENGKQGEYKLPPVQKEGITLQVNNNSASRLFIVVDRGQLNKQKFNKLFVIAQINGNLVYEAGFNLDEGESGASIVKKNLPSGIMQITVFDSTGIPLAERLAFISNYQINEPKLTQQKVNTARRGQNIFSFHIDSVTTPELSALITDPSLSMASDFRENIASSILLSTDIKGFINNPGYYFANKENETLENLDILLMTQGWRRFTWKQIKGEENIALKYPVETYMNIKGKVTKTDRSAPVTNGFVALQIKAEDSTSILSNAYITDKGEFIVDSLNFKTKAVVSYEGTDNKKTQLPVDVTIYPALIDTLKRSAYMPDVNLDTLSTAKNSFTNYIDKGISKLDTIYGLLENVTVKAKRLSPVDSIQKEYVSPFFQNSDQTLTIPENRNYINIWQFLNASVPGLNVNPFQPGGVTSVVFSRYEAASLEDSDSRDVKFLLNEIPVATEVIDALNPVDVALIKIYKGATAFAFGADAGAISIYTKKGVATGAAYEKKFARFNKIGFSYTREFYNPDYTAHPEYNKTEEDNRVTLYWNPKIKPGKNGDYMIEFYNNDITRNFKLIIQGIDSNGKLIYKEQIIK